MTKVSMSTRLAAPADAVWQLVGRFNALPDWHPAVEKSELTEEGQVRRLGLVGGGTLVERLEHKDDKERVYSYTIEQAPLPVADYRAEIRVREEDDGSTTVEWAGEFTPKGAPDADATKVVEGIYQAGLDNLRKMFGG